MHRHVDWPSRKISERERSSGVAYWNDEDDCLRDAPWIEFMYDSTDMFDHLRYDQHDEGSLTGDE